MMNSNSQWPKGGETGAEASNTENTTKKTSCTQSRNQRDKDLGGGDGGVASESLLQSQKNIFGCQETTNYPAVQSNRRTGQPLLLYTRKSTESSMQRPRQSRLAFSRNNRSIATLPLMVVKAHGFILIIDATVFELPWTKQLSWI